MFAVDRAIVTEHGLATEASLREASALSSAAASATLTTHDARPWAQPYVVAAIVDGRPTVRGMRSCLLGGDRDAGGRRATGVFAAWDWNGRRLVVRTDRFGFQPLFYAVHGTRLWVSPSIPELLYQGAPSTFDDAALAAFLRLGNFLGDDTPFLHIRAAPPGARIVWDAGRILVQGRRTMPPPRNVSRSAALDQYVEVVRAALGKTPIDPERTVIPLTGGRDSRHIALELNARGHGVRCATVRPAPPKTDEDLRVAAVVASALGLRHDVLETTHDRFADEVDKNLRTSFCALEHFWVMPLVRYASGRDLVLYDGVAGDTLSQARYMSDERLRLFRRRDFARYAAEELGTEAYLPAVLQRDAYRRFARGLALERLEAELRTHVDAANPVGSYRFWNRTRRAVAQAPFGLLAAVATVRAPFLDHDVFDFLASLPGELLADHTFHSDAIARGYPAYAHIPYENVHAPIRRATEFTRAFALASLRAEMSRAVQAHGVRIGALMRHGAYVARVAAMLAVPSRVENAGSLATLGVYLSQLENARRPA